MDKECWSGGAIGMLVLDRCEERGTNEVDFNPADSLEGATANASECVGREAATANAISAEPRNFIAFDKL